MGTPTMGLKGFRCPEILGERGGESKENPGATPHTGNVFTSAKSNPSKGVLRTSPQ